MIAMKRLLNFAFIIVIFVLAGVLWVASTSKSAAEKKLKERIRLERGFRFAFAERFEKCRPAPMTKEIEELLKGKNYDVAEFKTRKIPNAWSIDYSTIPQDAIFYKTAAGYNIISPQENIRFLFAGQRIDGMRSSLLFELTFKNMSDKESEITLGIHDSGLIKNGYETLTTEKVKAKEEKTIEVELSVFEQHTNIAPTVSVKGSIRLSNLTVYRKDHDSFTIVEGEIVERSALPDPKDTAYSDCRFTVHFVGNAILSGMPCNKELVLSIDGFRKKKLLPTNKLKKGDKIRCAIVPASSLPSDLASIQEADDLFLFILDSYLATTYSVISAYTDFTEEYNALPPFKSDIFEFKSAFDQGFNPPIPESVKAAQKKKIEKDLEEANKMIAYIEKNKDAIEQRFQAAWAKEKKRFPKGFNTIKKRKGGVSLYWRNVDNSFWCLPPDYTFIPQKIHRLPQSKIDATVAFKNFLESNGVQLIVSLVPDRYTISSRIINPEFKTIPDLQCATYVKQFSEAGVECPYEVTKILENYNKFQFAYLFPADYHPGATTQYAIAEEIGDRISRFTLKNKLDRKRFSHKQTATYAYAPSRCILPSNCDIGNNIPGERYLSDEIHYDNKPIGNTASAPILVLGNSFIRTPNWYAQDSLPAFLSERMLSHVQSYVVLGFEGPFTTGFERVFEHPEFFLKGKSVVIVQIGTAHCDPKSVWSNSADIEWTNVADIERKKRMLNKKKLIDTLFISGNGDYADDFADWFKENWAKVEGKNDIKCFDDKKFEIFRRSVPGIDAAKPLVCVVQTVRAPTFDIPYLFVNGSRKLVPASHSVREFFWQDVYFELPAGTSQLAIELQGKKGTIVGFNKILIYQ